MNAGYLPVIHHYAAAGAVVVVAVCDAGEESLDHLRVLRSEYLLLGAEEPFQERLRSGAQVKCMTDAAQSSAGCLTNRVVVIPEKPCENGYDPLV